MQANQEELKRGLGERHIRLIALGAAIGVGLFLGSAGVILIAHMKFRRSLTAAQREQLEFRMPLFPYASWIALAFLVLVIGLMAYFPDTRVALIVGPAWLVLVVLLYQGLGLGKRAVAAAT